MADLHDADHDLLACRNGHASSARVPGAVYGRTAGRRPHGQCAAARSLSSLPNLAGFCRDSGGIRDKAPNSGSYTPLAPRVNHITNAGDGGKHTSPQRRRVTVTGEIGLLVVGLEDDNVGGEDGGRSGAGLRLRLLHRLGGVAPREVDRQQGGPACSPRDRASVFGQLWAILTTPDHSWANRLPLKSPDWWRSTAFRGRGGFWREAALLRLEVADRRNSGEYATCGGHLPVLPGLCQRCCWRHPRAQRPRRSAWSAACGCTSAWSPGERAVRRPGSGRCSRRG
jgi:hypothetical protein